jgi:hypothetical protein
VVARVFRTSDGDHGAIHHDIDARNPRACAKCLGSRAPIPSRSASVRATRRRDWTAHADKPRDREAPESIDRASPASGARRSSWLPLSSKLPNAPCRSRMRARARSTRARHSTCHGPRSGADVEQISSTLGTSSATHRSMRSSSGPEMRWMYRCTASGGHRQEILECPRYPHKQRCAAVPTGCLDSHDAGARARCSGFGAYNQGVTSSAGESPELFGAAKPGSRLHACTWYEFPRIRRPGEGLPPRRPWANALKFSA